MRINARHMQRLQSKDLLCLPHRAVRAAHAGKQPRAVHAGVDLNVAVHALAAPLQNLRHVAAVLQGTGIDGNAVVRSQLDLRVLQGAEQQDRLFHAGPADGKRLVDGRHGVPVHKLLAVFCAHGRAVAIGVRLEHKQQLAVRPNGRAHLPQIVLHFVQIDLGIRSIGIGVHAFNPHGGKENEAGPILFAIEL